MPRWVVYCPRCNKALPHSEVTFEHLTADSFAPLGRKPNLPDGGLSLECPTCKVTSLYQRHQLIYLAD